MADLIAAEELPSVAKPEQVAIVVQTTADALAQDRYRRRGIPFVKIGGRVRYLREDVLKFLADNRIGGPDAA
ncbi:helix-turn-helix domain-containing protein [Mycobacterium sp. CVI_P3]|uniref:Helix-turn-helix domain-containing protein n=1 Tax=Mycobacterium pinniadriaticum TaxID=2994102 RepID=A0ABT3S8K9_9MYCO|nr:helix-turn-helix domain-containing protein [Mycobacterium pinniadriaticum]MCX2929273.1 helix-turn-helix domain-containing protein [Mycobacterium pinniadriaticum]MCX2935697.1 helix-turn-helix domain-containing protein [Mycobacterium pinniadriaticum]